MYNYPKKHLWDTEAVFNLFSDPITLRKRTPSVSAENMKLEEFIDSEMGEQTVLAMEQFIKYNSNEMDPGFLEYCEKLGLKKELFEADQLYTKWSLYTPLSMYKPENKDRKYPFMFVLHGATMPIYWEENSGFLPIAGREEMIVVSAQNHNYDNLLRIFNIVKEKCNIDLSRVYCTGYSQGGMQTNNITERFPEMFAAAAPCGIPMFLDTIDTDQYEHLKEYSMPVFTIGGDAEFLYLFPANADSPEGKETAKVDRDPEDPTLEGMQESMKVSMPYTGKGKIELLNKRLVSIGHKPLDVEEMMNVSDKDGEVAAKLGFKADNEEIREIFACKHYFGDFFNEEGDLMYRVVCVENHPHWPPATMPELAWEFMKDWRRDPETKKLYKVSE